MCCFKGPSGSYEKLETLIASRDSHNPAIALHTLDYHEQSRCPKATVHINSLAEYVSQVHGSKGFLETGWKRE